MKTLLFLLIGLANIAGCGKPPAPEPTFEKKKVIIRGYSEILPYEITVGWGFDGDPSKGYFHEVITTHVYYKEVIIDQAAGKQAFLTAATSNIDPVISTWDSLFCSVESGTLYMQNSIVFTDHSGSMDVPAFIYFPIP
jgi:hypothetical protein